MSTEKKYHASAISYANQLLVNVPFESIYIGMEVMSAVFGHGKVASLIAKEPIWDDNRVGVEWEYDGISRVLYHKAHEKVYVVYPSRPSIEMQLKASESQVRIALRALHRIANWSGHPSQPEAEPRKFAQLTIKHALTFEHPFFAVLDKTISLTKEEIIKKFEDEISKNPEKYLNVEEPVYQITQSELLNFVRDLGLKEHE